MVDQVNDEVLLGLCALAFLKSIRPLMMEHNIEQLGEFWKITHRLNLEQLLMAISRATDKDNSSVNVSSVLNYLEQNRKECNWLYSEEARQSYSNPDACIKTLLEKWRLWIESETVLAKVRKVRDKFLAHKDKAVVLSAATLDMVTLSDASDILKKLDEFLNDIRTMIDHCCVCNDGVHDAVVSDIGHTLEMYGIGIEQVRRMSED